DRLDQVGDEVVAPLQLHVDLRPGVLDPVALGDQAVVEAQPGEDDDADEEHGDDQPDHDGAMIRRTHLGTRAPVRPFASARACSATRASYRPTYCCASE